MSKCLIYKDFDKIMLISIILTENLKIRTLFQNHAIFTKIFPASCIDSDVSSKNLWKDGMKGISDGIRKD